jgi:hypothetical protein
MLSHSADHMLECANGWAQAECIIIELIRQLTNE